MKRALLSLALLGALAAPAAAQEMDSSSGGNTGIGVGAEALLTGPTGGAFTYDAGMWRITGILGYFDFGDQDMVLAGRFIYVLHDGISSDFGVGASLGLLSHDDAGPGGDTDDVTLEGIAQIRAFITPNVALTAAAGLAFVEVDGADDNVLDLTGQLVGSVGIHYYFW